MKKVIVGLFVGLVFFGLAGSVLAANPKSPADYNGLAKGKSETYHLYLYAKDANWQVVADGAWGKLTYQADKFVFNGHKLVPGADYTLIRYTDPWPGYPVVCLGTGVADDSGNVHLGGDWLAGGTKVWLVRSTDVNCGTQKMTGWHPALYLFEYNVVP